MRLLIILLFLSVSPGCGLFKVRPPDINPDLNYMLRLNLEINDASYNGVAVPDKSEQYEIKINPPGKIDRLIITNCHREIVVDKQEGKGWWPFKKKNEYEFIYKPIVNIEDNRACLMEITALEEKKKRQAWAIIDFSDSREELNLPAVVKCNGLSSRYDRGRSFCQSAPGLIQRIIFDQKVLVLPDDGCDSFTTKDQLTYELSMSNGRCTYYFMSFETHANGNRRVHRFSTYGYEEISYLGD